MVHHEDISDTSRQDLEVGHSGSRRDRGWRRGATDQGYLVSLFGTVKNPYIVQLQCESKNPGCQTLGPGNSGSSRVIFYYEQQVKRELERIHISGYRCNERPLCVYYEGIKRETNN